MMLVETAKGTCYLHTKISHIHHDAKTELVQRKMHSRKMEMDPSSLIEKALNLKH